MSAKKQAAQAAVQEEIEIATPEPASPPSPVATAPIATGPSREGQPIYTLFLNDQVASVGTGRVPTGSWYAVFMDLEHSVFHGPYPLLVPTAKGQTVLTGYCSVDNLKAIASKMFSDFSKKKWAEKPSPVYLQDEHKFMSATLWVHND